jgi:uncharacterized protein
MNFFRTSTVAIVALSLGAAAIAADLASAKAGMRARVPVIDRLKAAEQIGEANTGLLAARASSDEITEVVTAENADRQVVFAETAKRTGSSAEAVGKTFARQIAAASGPGVWLQREDGTWYRK